MDQWTNGPMDQWTNSCSELGYDFLVPILLNKQSLPALSCTHSLVSRYPDSTSLGEIWAWCIYNIHQIKNRGLDSH